MARRRKKRAIESVQHDDRWVVSYADFITLLFAFFTAMYAISSVNESKYQSASESLARAFNPSSNAVSVRIIEESKFVSTSALSLSDQFKNSLSTDYKEMAASVAQIQSNKNVLLIYGRNRVTVRISDSELFAADSDELTASGLKLIGEIGNALKEIPNPIRVEAHTDNRPLSTKKYQSNWELSNSKALSILKYLISKSSIPPTRLSATGFGEFRPVAANGSDKGRAKNRRVDIQILGRGYDK